MSSLIDHAGILYQISSGAQVSDEAFLSCMHILSRHNTDPENSHQIIKLRPQIEATLSQQKQTPQLLKKWREHFYPQIALNEQQAIVFISELLASIEDANDLLTQPIIAGTTVAERGSYSDFPVYRPYQKPGWSIHITTQGSGSYNCVRQVINSQIGDLFLFAPNSHFDYQRNKNVSSWTHQWIMFQPLSHWLMWLQWPQVGPGIFHLQPKDEQSQSLLRKLFNEIINLQSYQDALTNELRKNLVEQLLIRCQQSMIQTKTSTIDQRIQLTMDLLTKNIAQTMSIEQLAEHAKLSSSRLSTLFKQHTGTSIVKWREEQRMSQACQLLTYSSKPINQIADSLGYSDPLYFTRCFRQHFGRSPRQYRQQKIA
ncbi:MAG TPA: arabinose operon transcriptional regulator AraC [Porticoccus sp.]|nr:arabinose operon transcriptional regulator AraC [Porticoccus sp.]